MVWKNFKNFTGKVCQLNKGFYKIKQLLYLKTVFKINILIVIALPREILNDVLPKVCS